MNKIFLRILMVLIIIVAGFYALNSFIYNEKQGDYGVDHKNTTYLINKAPVQLVNGEGKTESETPSSVKYFGNEVMADFDADGREDIAFLLTDNSGGSGTFYYIVVALNKKNGYVGSEGFLIGDRISPQTTEVGPGNSILVNYADRAPTESFATAPHIGKTKYLLLNTTSLTLEEVVSSVGVWKKYTDLRQNITFYYPEKLGATNYIHSFDWPPTIQVTQEVFNCTEAGTSTARTGKTSLREISGNIYCVTEVVEGAAGSTYTQYAYRIKKGTDLLTILFSTRASQCMNYNEPQRSLCKKEQENFDVDHVVATIFRSIQ